MSTLANVVGFSAVMFCWWRAHVTAAAPQPYRRAASMGYGLVGCGIVFALVLANGLPSV